MVGVTRRGKATKIMAVADRHGLPIACGIASGQRHEATLVLDTLKARFVTEMPRRLILSGEKPCRLNQKDDYQYDEGIGILVFARNIGCAKAFDQAQENAAEHGAWNVADAA